MLNIKSGAIKSQPDERDYQWHRVAGSSLFDWDKGFDIEHEIGKKLGTIFTTPDKDQNGSYGCGGNAWGYYGGAIESMVTGTFEERSAKFIYAQTFEPNGGGSDGRKNCELVTNQGWGLEKDTPSYENGNPPSEEFMRRIQDITKKARDNASYSKSLVYANVNPDIDIFANAIKANNGLVFGIDGEDNGTWRSEFPLPPKKTVWCHWLYAGKARMINGKKYIGFINSWGENVGNKGWQWIGEDYFKSGHVWPGWTLPFNKANLVAKLKGEQLSLMKQLLNILKEQLAKLI